MTELDDSIRDLITSYHELNPDTIDELHDDPSALEFMRYVAKNRPFIIREGARDFPALSKWTPSYLKDVMSGQSVNVALTPYGNADSVIEMGGSSPIFAKPFEREVDFDEAFDYIAQQGTNPKDAGPVCYCQTQNDNLRNEYSLLFQDVPRSIPFARIALAKDPDAINLWIGNARSTTALHKDPYENIYVQVLGQKHFVLLPPIAAACVNERVHPAGTYRPVSGEDAVPMGDLDLEVALDEPAAEVPFATWDPDRPEENCTAFSALCRPLRVTLDPGDVLYLPALWYHKVSQSCNEDGICCAVNYWYDMEYSGSFFPLSTFSRRVGLIANV